MNDDELDKEVMEFVLAIERNMKSFMENNHDLLTIEYNITDSVRFKLLPDEHLSAAQLK